MSDGDFGYCGWCGGNEFCGVYCCFVVDECVVVCVYVYVV